jgi:hypothetical protein
MIQQKTDKPRPEEETAQRALQTVVAGQQAENLLDFDADEIETPGTGFGMDNGIASLGNAQNTISSQTIASVAKSTNPLDELMDLFSTSSMSTPAAAPMSAAPMSPMSAMTPSAPNTNAFGGAFAVATPSPPARSPAPAAAPAAQASATDDLLDLF